MKSKVRQLAEKINMPFDEFIGEMRKRGCSEPTSVKKFGTASLRHLLSLKTTICFLAISEKQPMCCRLQQERFCQNKC